MAANGETFRYRGKNLDLWLSYRFDRGLYLLVEARDKNGILLEGKEFEFNEKVVQEWVGSFVRRNLRTLLFQKTNRRSL